MLINPQKIQTMPILLLVRKFLYYFYKQFPVLKAYYFPTKLNVSQINILYLNNPENILSRFIHPSNKYMFILHF